MLKARRYRTERTEIYGDREFARMPRIRKEIKKGQQRRMRRSARFWIWEETSPNMDDIRPIWVHQLGDDYPE